MESIPPLLALCASLASVHAAPLFAAQGKAPRVTQADLSSSGAVANSGAHSPAISADGRFVGFVSTSTNLDPRKTTNTVTDVFVRDRIAETTELISVSINGTGGSSDSYAPAISGDGRFVAFTSDARDLVPGDGHYSDVFVYDRLANVMELVSASYLGGPSSGESGPPAVSSDGRFVAFASTADNLVGNDSYLRSDVFVRDRATGTTERASLSYAGTAPNNDSSSSERCALSADGRYVVFDSLASDIVPNDTNNSRDLFVRDRLTGTNERVNLAASGGEMSTGFSPWSPSISSDGRCVAFVSDAPNLVPGDSNGAADIFLRDRRLGKTERISLSTADVEANSGSGASQVSANGRFVVFTSGASNLVVGDVNGSSDVFIRDRETGTTSRVFPTPVGTSVAPSVSFSGRCVAFVGYADSASIEHLFVYQAPTLSRR